MSDKQETRDRNRLANRLTDLTDRLNEVGDCL